MKLLKTLPLYAVIIIPINNEENFLDLKYKKLKPNKVKISQEIEISVDKTASPLFYKVSKPQKYKNVIVEGEVEIKKELESEENDSYFQLGVVYAGDYRPGFFMRKILPEWILKVIDINEKTGLSEIQFLHTTNNKTNLNKSDNVRDIKLNFKTVTSLKKGKFSFNVPLKNKKVIGLWLRADGDDHDGVFITRIKKLELTTP